MGNANGFKGFLVGASVSALAIAAVLTVAPALGTQFGFVQQVQAETTDGSGGPDNAKGNQGGQGQGGQGAQSGQGNQGGQGSGQGGPDPDSDSKGPQAGGPADTGSGGGKPAWAQEGIPEVELGRLSVARSPSHVLDRAFAEALAAMSPDMIAFYNLSLGEMVDELSLNWDNLSIIDSPLQNLALFRDALDGTTDLAALGVTNDIDTLMAVFVGVASDKNVPVSTDTVLALAIILGQPMTEAEAAAVAGEAEAIRIAVLAGHG